MFFENCCAVHETFKCPLLLIQSIQCILDFTKTSQLVIVSFMVLKVECTLKEIFQKHQPEVLYGFIWYICNLPTNLPLICSLYLTIRASLAPRSFVLWAIFWVISVKGLEGPFSSPRKSRLIGRPFSSSKKSIVVFNIGQQFTLKKNY